MLVTDVRCSLEGHGAAAETVGGLDVGPAEADGGQEIEGRVVEILSIERQRPDTEVLAECPSVEDETDVERRLQRAFDLLQTSSVNPLARRVS